MAHCLPCKWSQITATFKPHEGENSSRIMILLHARGFFRSVLSTGSQHFLYMTQSGSYIETGKYIFFELGVKINNTENMMQTAFWPLCCSDASSLSLSLFFLVVTLFSIFPVFPPFPLSGLPLFRLVSSSWCSSVASLAPSSGGCRQHRISCSLKRAVPRQKACKGEFNNSRCVCVCAFVCMCVCVLVLAPKCYTTSTTKVRTFVGR